jgi:hypothetical protein
MGHYGSNAHKLFSPYCSSFLASFILLKLVVNLRCFISDGTLQFGGRHKDIVQTRHIGLYDVEFSFEKEHIEQSDQIIVNPNLSVFKPYLSFLLAASPLTVTFIQDLRLLRLSAVYRLIPISIAQKSCQKNVGLILVIIINKIKNLMRCQNN